MCRKRKGKRSGKEGQSKIKRIKILVLTRVHSKNYLDSTFPPSLPPLLFSFSFFLLFFLIINHFPPRSPLSCLSSTRLLYFISLSLSHPNFFVSSTRLHKLRSTLFYCINSKFWPIEIFIYFTLSLKML